MQYLVSFCWIQSQGILMPFFDDLCLYIEMAVSCHMCFVHRQLMFVSGNVHILSTDLLEKK